MELKIGLLQLLTIVFIKICCLQTVNSQSCIEISDFYNVVLKLVIALGKSGQYDEARAELQKVENYERYMSTVITHVYAKNYKNTERAIELLYGVNCDAYANGVQTLFSVMNESNHLSKPETLMLANQLDLPGCVPNKKVNETSVLIRPYVVTILNGWASDIRLGKYKHIYQFAESSDEQYHSLRRQLPTLVKMAFREGNAISFNNTLTFVKDLPYLRFSAPGYLTLVQELKAAGKKHSAEMLLVSYRIQETMRRGAERIKAAMDLTEMYANLEKEIPSGIRNIFSKSKCTIRNILYKEYLHAAKEPVTGGNGEVFTWITGYKITAAEWLLEPIILDGMLNFQVKNKRLSERGDGDFYLCEGANTKKVVTCNGDEKSETKRDRNKWIITPASWREMDDAFTLQNVGKTTEFWSFSPFAAPDPDVESRGYLQATKEYSLGLKRREVMDEFREDSSHWQIECD